MAKKSKKKTRRAKTGRFHVVMTDRIRLLLAICAVIGFVAVAIVALWK